MRDTKPVFFDEASQTWRVLRYDDAVHVLSEWNIYSNDMGRVMPARELVEGNVSMMDPPRHRQFRSIVSQAFTPRALSRLTPRITELAHRLLDAAVEHDEMEVVSGLAYPLPLSVIAELLGIPAEDRGVLERCADAQLDITSVNPSDEDFIRRREASMAELVDYLRQHARRRRAEPRDDLVSLLATAEADGKRLNDEEIVTFSALLLLAGHVTTMGLLSNVVVCLDEHPETLADLRADPSLVPTAVEEILRYRSPVQDAARISNQEVVLRGETISANQLVVVSTLSADRDERQFADPDRFDIRRNPNPHLALSHGAHFCLGAHLARAEAQVFLRALFERFLKIQVMSLEWNGSDGLTAPRRLVITTQRI